MNMLLKFLEVSRLTYMYLVTIPCVQPTLFDPVTGKQGTTLTHEQNRKAVMAAIQYLAVKHTLSGDLGKFGDYTK